ncbi:MAG TPA: DinB family protein [Bryobacteraceae bacterium]|nr:DinB family protein [Bryobacteraceae bacterium]
MKNTILGLGLCAVGLWAADAPADTSLAQQADRQIASVEKEVVSLAEAMPADKFDFAPTTGAFQGVRTFALQMRHMALVNHELAAALLGEKLPDPGKNENGPDALKSKTEIVGYLKDSFTHLHKAIIAQEGKSFTEAISSPFGGKSPRGYLVNVPAWHCFDHYGQAVVYARMNNIVPPASR